MITRITLSHPLLKVTLPSMSKRLRKKQAEVLALASVLPDVSATAGKPIQCKAMVARGPKQPLALETITVDPPKAGEVRVKVIANALCHTVRFNLICFFFSILGYLFTLTTIMNKMKNIHSGHLHSGKLLLELFCLCTYPYLELTFFMLFQ